MTLGNGMMYSLEDIKANLAVAKQHREQAQKTVEAMQPVIDAIVHDYKQEIATVVYDFSDYTGQRLD